MMLLTRVLPGVVAVFGLARMAMVYAELPERVASHFNAAGEADAWMSKTSFAIVYAVALFGTFALFFAIPLLVQRTPDRLINLPNKDFWLAPARRERTFRTLQSFFALFSLMTIALLVFVFDRSFSANLSGGKLDLPITVLSGYFIAVAVWLVVLIAAFARKPNA